MIPIYEYLQKNNLPLPLHMGTTYYVPKAPVHLDARSIKRRDKHLAPRIAVGYNAQ
jgi:hypothetical protein